MKLYSVILPLLIFGVFGYVVYKADQTNVNGHIQPDALVDSITDDYKDVEAFFAAGESANHNRYND